MRLAVSSTGPDIADLVDPRFGRCRYYCIVNTENDEFNAVENTGARSQ